MTFVPMIQARLIPRKSERMARQFESNRIGLNRLSSEAMIQ